MTSRRWIHRSIRGPVVSLSIVAVVLTAAGCIDVFGGSGLELTLVVSDTIAGPDRPITLTVTATSTGKAVVWGQGSSSCQLAAVVRVGGVDRPIDVRACTDDLVLQGVAAGDTLTEAWSWKAEYAVDGALDTLPTGRYRLYTVAGDLERSRGVVVRVVND